MGESAPSWAPPHVPLFNQGANLFVGSLPSTIDEASFRQFFEQFGTIVSMRVFPEKKYGFVKFTSREEGEAAIRGANGLPVEGRKIEVRMAEKGTGKGEQWTCPSCGFLNKATTTRANDICGGNGPMGCKKEKPGVNKAEISGGVRKLPTTSNPAEHSFEPSVNLYVKLLPPNMTEDSVKALFLPYGVVASAKVIQTQAMTDDGPTSVALVKMVEITTAIWLVQNLHGNIPQGLTKPVHISFSCKPNQAAGKGAGSSRFDPYGGGPQGKGKGLISAAALDELGLTPSFTTGALDELGLASGSQGNALGDPGMTAAMAQELGLGQNLHNAGGVVNSGGSGAPPPLAWS